jgi:hypothetical protein
MVNQKGTMTDPSTYRVRQQIIAFIGYQHTANSRLPLARFRRIGGREYHLHPELVEFTQAERQGILRVIDAELDGDSGAGRNSLLGIFCASAQQYIYRYNQFIHLRADHHAELRELYGAYLAEMAALTSRPRSAGAVAQMWAAMIDRHMAALQAFVVRFDADSECQGQGLTEHAAVCAEYPVPLQLDILGVAAASLREPILDVGCGYDGVLVRYLRDRGLRAWGIDRLVAPAEHLVESDWLEYEFGLEHWGTIISHMAFSNHFIFQHLYRYGEPERYAYRYVEMLRALRVGGALIYTPGLPFIEPHLSPAEYTLTRHAVAVRDSAPSLVGDVLYATRIVRRA